MIRQRYSGNCYCGPCFVNSVQTRVLKTIECHRSVVDGDKVAVAVSGGKDSVMLLHVISQIQRSLPKFKLVAVTVDEGIEGYSQPNVAIASWNARNLGVLHYIFFLGAVFGTTLDEIAELAKPKSMSICSICGILRRSAINIAGRRVGATKIATGHNLDDLAETFIMNVLDGNFAMAIPTRDENQVGSEKLIPRIKPLSCIPAHEIALYMSVRKLCAYSKRSCPYATGLRDSAREFLNRIEHSHPDVKFKVASFSQKLARSVKIRRSPPAMCRVCGEPSSQEVCKACMVLISLGLKAG